MKTCSSATLVWTDDSSSAGATCKESRGAYRNMGRNASGLYRWRLSSRHSIGGMLELASKSTGRCEEEGRPIIPLWPQERGQWTHRSDRWRRVDRASTTGIKPHGELKGVTRREGQLIWRTTEYRKSCSSSKRRAGQRIGRRALSFCSFVREPRGSWDTSLGN